jgi:GT2 family glycosyltransferase
MKMSEPKVISIVIPTYNRLAQLKRTIAALCCQTYPLDQIEVIIVSDGSEDGTAEYLQNLTVPFKTVPVLQKNSGAAAARNNGIQNASSEIILFIDDDIIPGPCLVEEHYQWHLKHGEKSVVIGPMLTPSDHKMSPWVMWEQEHLEEYYHSMNTQRWSPSPRQFYTGNSSLRRKHLIDAGGFDVRFRRAEDVELAYRLQELGLSFFFNPNALSYHYAERSFQSWIGAAYDYGKNDVIFTHEKGQTWLLPALFEEFFTRNLLVQWLIRVCLGRPGLSEVAFRLMKGIIVSGRDRKPGRIDSMVCSGLYNLRYYQGISDQIGGRKVFFKSIRDARTA